MDDKTSDTINNICTILGGALLLFPLIDQATKTIIPEMEKLTSGKSIEDMKLLSDGHEKDHEEEKERKPEQEPEHKREEEHKC